MCIFDPRPVRENRTVYLETIKKQYMKTGKIILWVILGMIILVPSFIFVRSCSMAVNMADNGFKTVEQQFSPSELLKKYEYFKDLSAAIDKKRADIEMYQTEISSYTISDKDDKFYIQQKKNELIGIISMHNSLCAKYNADMSKFNYRFTNAGDLPDTNLDVLPREYKPYINKLSN